MIDVLSYALLQEGFLLSQHTATLSSLFFTSSVCWIRPIAWLTRTLQAQLLPA